MQIGMETVAEAIGGSKSLFTLFPSIDAQAHINEQHREDRRVLSVFVYIQVSNIGKSLKAICSNGLRGIGVYIKAYVVHIYALEQDRVCYVAHHACNSAYCAGVYQSHFPWNFDSLFAVIFRSS